MYFRFVITRVICLLGLFLLTVTVTRAQFTANIQGTIGDPSGAEVSGAKITLENLSNHITSETTSDTSGLYRFLSLAPGQYKISVEATGFSRSVTTVTLETSQDLNVPIALKVGSASESVTVTGENPIFNTTETRNQQTIQSQELSTLPLGRPQPALTHRRRAGRQRPRIGGRPGRRIRHAGLGRRQLLHRRRQWTSARMVKVPSPTCGSSTASTSPAASDRVC